MESTIVTTEQLKLLTSISSNLDCELLQPHLLIAQQLYVQPVLGDPLYSDIISRYDNQTLTGNTLNLYNEYLIPAIGFSAWYSAAPFLAYKTNRSGIQTQGSADTVPLTPEELSIYISRVENYKDFYLKRLNDFLIKDNGVMFPLFRSGDTPVNNNKGGGLFLNFKHRNPSNNGCCPDAWMYN